MSFQSFKAWMFLFICSLLIISCKKGVQQEDNQDNISSTLLDKIKAEGYSTRGIVKVAGGYIVEGDIFLSDKILAQKSTSRRFIVAQSEQYRTNNMIEISGSRVITVSATGLPPAYVAATDEAIARYNALNLRLTFRRIASGAEIDIQNANLGGDILGASGGPDANGNPFNLIWLNAGLIGSSPNQGYLATIIAHEMGHTIGFRHTDYFNRSYSCGYVNYNNNEGNGSAGAVHIPGTPTTEDPNSWMLACANGANRPFNANDQQALRAMYGIVQQMGIGSYDLLSASDQAFAFDYNSSGKADHLVLYRPGTGILNVVKNTNGKFTQVFASNFQGIGGYDLRSTDDKVFAFDYTGSGKADHLVLYRPGTGIINIVKNVNGNFTQVFASNFQGIGSYDLRSTADLVFPFDYTGSGKADHLVLYRPGTGIINIVKNVNGTFTQVFASNFQGIGSYDLRSTADRVFAYDYTSSGKADHLVLYRPGTGILNIVKNVNGTFTQVFASNFQGIGGYDLRSTADKVWAYDYNGNGKVDHLMVYRPGIGYAQIFKNVNNNFSTVFASSQGIGQFDLHSTDDKIIPYDYSSNGINNHLFIYRPGTGIVQIIQNNSGTFNRIF